MAIARASRTDWPRRRFAALVLGLVLAVAAFVASLAVVPLLQTGPNQYNVAAWEARNVASKWLYAFGDLFRGGRSEAEQDADIARFFSLVREIDTLERQQSDALQRGEPQDPSREAGLAARREERDRLENRVEATIESRLTRTLEDEGITRDFGLFHAVWPPVDFEFTNPPRNLAISPRDEIKLTDTELLREDLSLEEVEAIEAQKQQQDNVSALAFTLGGLSAYPTIIAYDGDYQSALATIAHEWLHNYLFFRPLGLHYAKNYDVRSINETVAELAGQELARDLLKRWPAPAITQPSSPPAAASPAPSTPQPPSIDIGAELRKLRGEVDALLAQHKLDEAEALMEQRRQEFAEKDYRFRKINQAYFAFTNLYAGEAGSPGATNPIGPKVDELRRRSPTLRVFLNRIGGVTSVAGLDKALSEAP
ncbi:MAG TPA: hypothetical protein VI759_09655 [Dehalococcoidia bacterium]|nr:hypothetical protein [Dehalococcoidia bacterium]